MPRYSVVVGVASLFMWLSTGAVLATRPDTFSHAAELSASGEATDADSAPMDSPDTPRRGGPLLRMKNTVTSFACNFLLVSNEGLYYDFQFFASITAPDGRVLAQSSNGGYKTAWHSAIHATDSMPITGTYTCTVDWYINGIHAITDSGTWHVTTPPPYTEIGSQSGGPYLGEGWRLDVWYFVWRYDHVLWPAGGTVTEEFEAISNPCDYDIVTGSMDLDTFSRFLDTYWEPPLDAGCAMTWRQRHFLSTSEDQVITDQRVYYGWKTIEITR